MYFSNRSAAYSQLKKYDLSLRDAKSAIRLKPKWVKGWARLASAHFGLEEYPEAKEAYEKALSMEPEDENLKQGLYKVIYVSLTLCNSCSCCRFIDVSICSIMQFVGCKGDDEVCK